MALLPLPVRVLRRSRSAFVPVFRQFPRSTPLFRRINP